MGSFEKSPEIRNSPDISLPCAAINTTVPDSLSITQNKVNPEPSKPTDDSINIDKSEATFGYTAAILANPLDTSWQEQAICLSTEPNFFFQKYPEEAIEFCQDCPVKQECLDYAVMNSIEHGVWGGTSERERRRIKRELITIIPNAKKRRSVK